MKIHCFLASLYKKLVDNYICSILGLMYFLTSEFTRSCVSANIQIVNIALIDVKKKTEFEELVYNRYFCFISLSYSLCFGAVEIKNVVFSTKTNE